MSTNSTDLTNFESLIYVLRRGSETFSVIYDVTGDKSDPPSFYKQARQVFPQGIGLGITTHHDNRCTLIEIILNSEEAYTEAYKNPIVVPATNKSY
ncbi:hypothetical protein INT45_001817 [Circinella minor]|uniref:Uncharacterized protein n=1 Tax=Circinella minor TaxID=1195481 RepID=A0A8H7RSQ6_9FUNG|nr:hypothetical protein INT45_001817 [Circinella minor]